VIRDRALAAHFRASLYSADMGFAFELSLYLLGVYSEPPVIFQRKPRNDQKYSKMTATTTETLTAVSTQQILKDYELHHSGGSGSAPPPNANPPPPRVQNPPTWDNEHHRVPPYRPINRELDLSVRRVYNNNAERNFVSVMFTGVFLQAVGVSLKG